MRNILIILFCVPVFIFGQNSIKYIENNGQWGEHVLYQADISSGKVYLEEKSITYNFFDIEKLNSSHLNKSDKPLDYLDHFSYKVDFLNTSRFSKVISQDKRSEYYNYFIGSNKEKWKNNVSAYNSIFYSSIYKGIDCKFYSQDHFLKYDFIIAPGYNPNQIQLLYSGVELYIKDNEVIIDLGFEKIIETKPIAYQIINDIMVTVKCNYILKNNIISFEFPQGYNNNSELIIDPVLITSTLSGSQASTTWGHSATYDTEGNIYTGARCFSSGYPTTTGSYQINYAGGTNDIAISKLDSTGSTLTWATYLGGSGDDFPHSLIVNSQNELCVYGSSTSSDYPTSTSAYDNSTNGASDIIITHLDSAGANLIGSSYFGGSSDDGLNYIVNNYGDDFRGEIMVDDFDNIFIASFSSSSDFPTTSGVYQQSLGGGQDAIVLKANSDLSSLVWSTYIGGSGFDAGYGIRVDNNSVYLTGSASSGFPVISGSAITTFIGGSYDGFVAKFNHQATALLASTYFGTSSTDQSFFIDLDKDSSIYIYGQNGDALSISSGCYGVTNSRQFIAKFNNTLSNIEWQTTLGSGSSSTDFVPIAFLVDVCNNIYISGHGGLDIIPSMFTTSDALYTSGGFYLMQLSPEAASVDYATYYTGNHVDGGTSRFDPSGVVYQAVCSCPFLTGGTMSTTSNAYSTVHYGDCDIGVFKLDFETSPALAIASANPANGTAPLTIAFTNSGNGTSFFWDFDDNGTTSTLINPIHTYTNAGTYYVQLIATDSSSCNISDTLILAVIVTSPPCSISLLDSSNISCYGSYDGFIEVQGTGSSGVFAYSLQVFNTILNSWTEIAHSPLSGSYISYPVTFPNLNSDSFLVIMTDSLGCVDTLNVFLSEPPLISSTQNIVACDHYIWNGSSYDSSGIYFDTLVSLSGCDSVLTLNLTINNSSTVLIDTACGQYFYNGISYDSSGIYYDTLVSIYGCDSIIELDIIVFQDSSINYITACDSVQWNGIWYYNDTTVTDTGFTTNSYSGAGCDSVATAIITINNSTFDTTDVIATDNYLWPVNGINYTSSGIYTNISANSSGCTYTQLLNLIINISGCTDSLALNYNPLATIDDGSCIDPCNIVVLDSSNITCFGYNDGFIDVHGSGINNNFNYQLQAFDSLYMAWITIGQSPLNGNYTQNPVSFPNLYSGCYRIIMTDSLLCSDTANICLTQPNVISAVASITNSNSLLNNNGSIILTNIIGGTGSYTYLWNGPNSFTSNTQNIFNLESGFYTLVITDDSLCLQSYIYFVDLAIAGCTDSTANNFDPSATLDDSTCCYLNFYNDDIIICIGDSIELLYSGSLSNVDSFIWSTGDTSSSLFVSPNVNTTYWLTQVTNGYSCSDTINVIVSCLDFSPTVLVSLSNLNCGLTDLTISVSQDSNEVDMDSAIFISDAGSFTISTMNIGDNIGTASMSFGNNMFNTNLIINSIPAPNQIIVEAVHQSNGLILGTFTITNLQNGGVEIIVVSPGDGNNYTNGNNSVISFINVFVNPNTSPLNFTTTITSELGDTDVQSFSLTICCDAMLTVTVTACDSYNWNGISYSTSGVYIDTLLSINNCDSTVTLDLTIVNSYTTTSSITSCDDYTWLGTTYTSSGLYDSLFFTVDGCDSLVILDLTLTNSDTTTTPITSCDDYTWLGTTYTVSGLYDSLFTNVDGCDSLAVLNLTITNSDTTTSVVTACDSYTWNGLTLFTSGVYDSLFTNIEGCDSLAILDLTINYSDTTTSIVTSCDDYTWLGTTYTSSGLYDSLFFTVDGCDSLAVLNLTITNSDTTTSVVTSCDSYTWNGFILSTTGVYDSLFTNFVGCDSLVTLDLTITNSDTTTSTITSCDSYLWNGTSYTTTGVYDSLFTNIQGCDSLAVLDLTISNSDTTTSVVTSCDFYLWNGQTYLVSGIYDSLSTNIAGCDSLAVLDLTINNSDTTTSIVTSCDSYLWNGTTYTTSGIYDSLFTNIEGCDSLVILDLTINYSDTTTTAVTSCDSYIWNGLTYTTSGVYDSLFTNIEGCDSLAYLNLIIYKSDTTTTAVTSCDSYIWNGLTYTSSGIYDSLFTNIEGCDSLTVLDLTINYSDTTTTTVTSCDSYTWNGLTYTSSGIYDSLFTNIEGCDSLAILDLFIVSSYITTTAINSCDFYTWNGLTYTTSGIYDSLFTNLQGCDSLAILELTIYSTYSFTDTIQSCDNFNFNGVIYDSSGVYSDTLMSIYGCDSIRIIDLTIYNSYLYIDTVEACDSYIFVFYNGIQYDTSGVYSDTLMSITGCDSIITLVLTINYSSSSLQTIISCNSYIWNGQTYLVSGIYDSLFTKANGCDSLATLDLTIAYNTSSLDTISSCDFYLWNGLTYTTSGVYDSLFTNANGCDSLAMLILTIIDSDTTTTAITSCDSYTWNGLTYITSGFYDNLFTNLQGCDSLAIIDLTITNSDTTTTAVTSCDFYLWYGTAYTTSGIYDSLFINIDGCDSLTVLDLTITNSDTTTTAVTSCDSYLWNGTAYTTSGLYDSLFTNIQGCDSLAIFDLTIINSDTTTSVVTSCDTYTWNGTAYTTSGVYDSLFTNFVGCDSLSTLDLTITNSDTTTTAITSCDSYTWNGITYTTSGVYDSLFTNIEGCDSLTILDLTIINSDTTTTAVISCDPYTWNGLTYSLSGVYDSLFTNTNGCDSLAILDLTVNNSTASTFLDTACDNYIWDGITYDSSGFYTNIYSDIFGCDSTVNLYLIINISGCTDPLALNYNPLAICSDTCLYPACNIVLLDSQNVSCYSGNDGYIEVGGTGGIGYYHYSLQIYNSSFGLWQQIGQSPLGGGYTYANVTFTTLFADCYKIVLTDSLSCNDTLDICLSQPLEIISSDTVISCDSYNWNGISYSTSGVYIDTLLSINNCDSIVTLNLTILNSTSSFVSITSCDSYLWNGVVYTTSGVYDSLFTNFAGCDSLAILDLTVNYSDTTTSVFTSCDTYIWNGTAYTTSGVYDSLFTNFVGCDSLAYLDLTITNSDSSTTVITSCDSYTWNGITYTSSGLYDSLFTNSVGCDSLAILDLAIISSTSSLVTTSSCDSYLWNGITYTSTGLYDSLFTNFVGCDSLATLDLTITNSDTTTTAITSCDSYTWNGITYTSSGLYDSLFINIEGCDSLAYLDLTITNSDSSTTVITSCDSYTWNGITYTSSGLYDSLFTNSVGCDSLAILDLAIISSTSSLVTTSSCDSYLWNGITYTSTGLYDSLFTNFVGCDSLATLDLTITNSDTTTTAITSCDSYTWNGITYTSSGLYDSLFTNSVGCDSLAILDLAIISSYVFTDTIEACDSYNFNGVIYDSPGVYSDTLLSINGCDSIRIIDLTINYSTSSTLVLTSCDSYTWNGITYTSSGLYDSLFVNSQGCDSLAQIYLTIIPPIITNLTIEACNLYSFGGTIYDTSGIYIDSLTSLNGCDSIVNLTLYVSANLSASAIITNVDCYEDSSGQIDLDITLGIPPYSYIWSNGSITQDISQLFGDSLYSCSIIDSLGCDLDTSFFINEPDLLSVNPNITHIACYGGNTGNISLIIYGGISPYMVDWGNTDTNNLIAGFYNYLVTDSNGCYVSDSIEILQEDQILFNLNTQNIQCYGENTGFIELDIQLNSGFPPYQFDWLGPNLYNSNSEDIYNLFAGVYDLVITDANMCTADTSIELIQPINIPQINDFETSDYNGYEISCNGENDGWIHLNITDGYGPYTYIWSNLANLDSIFDLPSAIYSVEITDSLGCISQIDIPLIEPLALSVILSITSNYNGYDISCFGQNDGAIQAIPSGGVPSYYYNWNSSNLNDSIINLSAGNYVLNLFDENNCEYVDSIVLNQPDSLNMIINEFPDTCNRGVGRAFVSVSGGIQPYNYNWSNGSNLSDINNFYQGNYSLIVLDDNSCELKDSISIDNLPGPIIDFNIFSEWEKLYEQLEDPIVFIDMTNTNGQEMVSWNWDFGDNTYAIDSIAYHSYSDTGTYTVTLITATSFNCMDTLTKSLKITDYNIYIPNAFTPFSTDDELNNEFKAYGIGVVKFKMVIFNRWGEKIFFSHSITQGWDGTSINDNNQVPFGIYFYSIEVENIYGQDYKYQGQVKLLR